MSTPAERYTALLDALAGQPGVTGPGEPGRRGFGASALKVNGSIFAMLSGGRLVVKLPHDRVAALIQEGDGGPFDAGKGTPMREWLAVVGEDEGRNLALAREALEFVSRRSTTQ